MIEILKLIIDTCDLVFFLGVMGALIFNGDVVKNLPKVQQWAIYGSVYTYCVAGTLMLVLK